MSLMNGRNPASGENSSRFNKVMILSKDILNIGDDGGENSQRNSVRLLDMKEAYS